MKKILFALICAASSLMAADPTPIPVAATTPPPNETLSVKNIPPPVIEGLKQFIVQSGQFAFTDAQKVKPVISVSIVKTGTTFQAFITLGPTP